MRRPLKLTRTFWALLAMPRSRSMSIEWRYCARMSLGSTAPVSSKIRSDSVDLPWSMCAMMLRLRILLESTDEEEVATVTQGYRHAVKTLEVEGFSRPLLASIGPRAAVSRTDTERVVRGKEKRKKK